MAMTTTWWLGASLPVLACPVLVAILIPLFLHLVIYRSSSSSTLPTFMLVGPSGAGKTALLTLIERGKAATTCTSQAPRTVEASVPVDFEAASNRYRSTHDPSARVHKKFLLTDTPGHGKLRHHALGMIRRPANLRGIMFVVDATALGAESPGLKDVAEYLHDVLLDLQTARTSSAAKLPPDFAVLIVVNKLDLFTALPADMARLALEDEISKIRTSRAKGILDAGVGADAIDNEKEWLGAGGEGLFTFGQMEDAGVVVTLEGSKAQGQQGEDIEALWTWMGNQL